MLTCVGDDALPLRTSGKRLQQAGPPPTMSVSEGITIEVVGRSVGLTQEKALNGHVRRRARHVFPALSRMDRTTVVRQTTILWAVKARGWMRVHDDQVTCDPDAAIVERYAWLMGHVARATRSRRCRGEAADE